MTSVSNLLMITVEQNTTGHLTARQFTSTINHHMAAADGDRYKHSTMVILLQHFVRAFLVHDTFWCEFWTDNKKN